MCPLTTTNFPSLRPHLRCGGNARFWPIRGMWLLLDGRERRGVTRLSSCPNAGARTCCGGGGRGQRCARRRRVQILNKTEWAANVLPILLAGNDVYVQQLDFVTLPHTVL